MKRRFILLIGIFVLSISLFATTNVIASDFPIKPIQIVIPYNPGGGNDLSARIVVKYLNLNNNLPVEVVVTNITGAGGRTAETEVKNSEPNGYKLLWQQQGMHLAHICGTSDHTWEDFTPVASVARAAIAVVVSKDSPYNTINEIIEDAKANPKKVKWGIGALGISHFSFLEILNDTSTDLENFLLIPIPDDKGRIVSLMQGDMDVSAITFSSLLPYLESGDLKIIGIMSKERLAGFEEYPTLSEQGVDSVVEYDYTTYAPKNLPEDVLATLSNAFVKTMEDPRLIEELQQSCFYPAFYVGEELINKVKNDYDNFKELADKFDLVK